MTNNVIQASFAGGEFAPSFFGRTDTAQYKIGAALMRNWFVDYRGGASNRPGSQFVCPVQNSTYKSRLYPFRFSASQNYILEFGNFIMRVIVNGAVAILAPVTVASVALGTTTVVTTSVPHGYVNGDNLYLTGTGYSALDNGYYIVANATSTTFEVQDLFGASINSTAYTTVGASSPAAAKVYTLVTPYSSADIPTLKFSQANNVITVTHPLYQPRNFTRTGVTNWSINLVSFTSSIAAPAAPTLLPVISASTASSTFAVFGYAVTAVDAAGQESVASAVTKTAIVPNIATQAGSIEITWPQVSKAVYYNIYKTFVGCSSASVAPDFPTGATLGYIGQSYGLEFVDTNITANYVITPPLHIDPFTPQQINTISVSAGGTGYTTSSIVTVTDATGSGFVGLPVVLGGALVAIIILNGGGNYTAPTITVSVGTGAVTAYTLSPSTGTWPSLSTYFQQRQVYAASLNQPETVWGTKVGLFNNMDSARPVNDGCAYSFTLAALQLNDIKWTIPMPGGLVTMTGSGVWQLSGGGQNAPMTPTNIVANPQAYSGVSNVPPIPINYDILYVQAKGSIVRDLSYNFFANIYTGEDTTTLSSHLFNPRIITEWAYAEEPNKIIWAVRDDGVLLSLTYVKEQKLAGWSWHTTQGTYESVATIQEGTEDAVYKIVRRFVNGQWMRYIERDASRHLNAGVDDAWFVDAGLNTGQALGTGNLTGYISGTNLYLTCSSATLAGAVGKIWRGGNGVGQVTASTATTMTVGIWQAPSYIVYDDPSGTIYPITQGNWTLDGNVSTIYGLRHLNGLTVKVFADCNVQADRIVVDGSITLAQPASKVVAGLGYSAQLQTLPLDIGEPTVQGKLKKIPAVTLKVVSTRGLAVGTRFGELSEIKDYEGMSPIPLYTGNRRVNVAGEYTTGGQICIQQNYPLPATVLSVINEVVLGSQ